VDGDGFLVGDLHDVRAKSEPSRGPKRKLLCTIIPPGRRGRTLSPHSPRPAVEEAALGSLRAKLARPADSAATPPRGAPPVAEESARVAARKE